MYICINNETLIHKIMEKQTLKDGMKVRMPRGARCGYFTLGKEYTVREVEHERGMVVFRITNDMGSTSVCSLKECFHLDLRNWIIVK